MTTFKVKDIGDQQLLDRADAAYKRTASEYGNVPTIDGLTDALMAAWEFIESVTRQESE